MKITGTIHLNEASSDRYQFIYGSLYNGSFVALYGKFIFVNKLPSKLSLYCQNYSEDNYLINNAYFESEESHECSNDDIIIDENPTMIHCLILKIDLVKNKGNSRKDISIENVKFDSNKYLQILREDDKGEPIKEENLKFLSECFEVKKGEKGFTSPGKICPRGYSKIIL